VRVDGSLDGGIDGGRLVAAGANGAGEAKAELVLAHPQPRPRQVVEPVSSQATVYAA
jgi:hypothetical protein